MNYVSEQKLLEFLDPGTLTEQERKYRRLTRKRRKKKHKKREAFGMTNVTPGQAQDPRFWSNL